jgi:hypothetical protein
VVLGQGSMEGLVIRVSSRGAGPFGGVFRGRKVLLTGHTGFKGSWLALWLTDLGAEVSGYSLEPPTS